MKLFRWKRDRLKFLGIKILRRKNTANGKLYLLFGFLPVYFYYNPLSGIAKDFSYELPFDVRSFDQKISNIVDKLAIKKANVGDDLVILATEIYDMGGHTECIKNIVAAMPSAIQTHLFLTHIEAAKKYSENKIKEIAQYSNVDGVQYDGTKWKSMLFELYKKILKTKPKVVFSAIHMNDEFGATLLAMLKKSGIRILFYNHGSHYPALGMSFADLILEGTKTTEKITREERKFDNTHIVGLPYLKEADLPQFSVSEINAKRKELGVPEGMILTMSGATSYKFFNEKKLSSDYLQMIRRLLENNRSMFHVIITNPLSSREQGIFDQVFDDFEFMDRLKIVKHTHNYKILFKCADIFIDSFPVSSALTQVDLISLQVPNIIKINDEKPMWTFHEYMPPQYPYAFSNVSDMEHGIEKLMNDANERKQIAETNYEWFLKNYEGGTWIQGFGELCNA